MIDIIQCMELRNTEAAGAEAGTEAGAGAGPGLLQALQ